MELKKMTDTELALRMVDYIGRTKKLMDDVSVILNRGGRTEPSLIDAARSSYKGLKEAIRADAHYVSLSQNVELRHNLYSGFFVPSVLEASAYGFKAPTNSKINQSLFSAIEEAHYRLKKYHGLDIWIKIAGS